MAVDTKYLHSEITGSILQAFYTVLKKIPNGLPVEVYKRALAIECEFLGLNAENDKEIKIFYRQKPAGSFKIDLVINDSVIIKVIKNQIISDQFIFDAKNQLFLSDFEVCLILNIDQDGMHKRIVYTNDIKKRENH